MGSYFLAIPLAHLVGCQDDSHYRMQLCIFESNLSSFQQKSSIAFGLNSYHRYKYVSDLGL
jgi:hypothetical protein